MQFIVIRAAGYGFALLAAGFVFAGSGIGAAEAASLPNLIQNPSMTDAGVGGLPAGWFRGGYGDNDATYTYPVSGKSGPGAKVEITRYASGDAKVYFAEVPVTAGNYYEFRDFYQSNVPNFVTVQYRFADGTLRYMDIGMPEAAGKWEKFETVFRVPSGVVSMTIFHLIKEPGFIVTDEYSLAELKKQPIFEEGFVSLNFDDGWLSQYEEAAPILAAAGLKATFYITTERLGQTNFMTADQVLGLYQSGHEIGAHTRTHPHLPLLTKDQMREEIVGSKRALQGLGVADVMTFSYPFGEWDTTSLRIVKNEFKGARGSGGIFNEKIQNIYVLNSFSLRSDTAVETIKQWIDQADRDKTWLILVFHRIDESDSSGFDTSSVALQEIVDYLVDNQVPVKTNAEGIALIKKN